MAQPASSNRKSTSNGPQASFTPGQPPSSTAHPVPRLSQTQIEQNSATLTHAQRALLDSLRNGAHELRWSADGKNAATRDDVLEFFTKLKVDAAQLHEIHDAHPTTPELASCIKALEQLLKRFDDALKPNAGSGIAVADFDLSACRTVFGALSALADPAWPSLFNRAQRRALQPLMQDLSVALLLVQDLSAALLLVQYPSAALLLMQDPSVLLLPPKARFAMATGASEHLPLLNWICRGVKKDLLKPDDHIAALFESTIGGIAAWLDDADVPKESRHIGECAAILNTVIDRDLLNLKGRGEAAQQHSRELTQCALLLCSEHSFAVLAKPPVNGVAVINLCNLVKDLIEREAVSIDRAQPQLQRLLALIIAIPNQAMSGGDGRVLSNVGNFLRMLMTRAPADGAQRKAHAEMLMPACRRVLAALNAEAFGNGVKNAQSLSNLASFLQEFHRYALFGAGDEGLRENVAAALGKLIARILATHLSAFDDPRSIVALLDAFTYLQDQGLCGDAAALQAFCRDLRVHESGLLREKVAAPAPLESLDAELPKLSAEPTLKTGEAGPGNAPAEVKRRIPGEGAIVRPMPSLEAAQIVPGTTYLRPTAGRGKFARAGKVEVDAFSLAARDAFVETNDNESGEDDEQEEELQSQEKAASQRQATGKDTGGGSQQGNGGASRGTGQGKGKGKGAGGGNITQRGGKAGRRAHSPLAGDMDWSAMAAQHAPDADMLGAAIRNGNAQSVKRMMQEWKGNPERPLPQLPASFLADACREKFFNDRGRVKAMDAYLCFLDKADKDRLEIQFGKSPSLSPSMHVLLAKHGTRKRYGLNQYREFMKALDDVKGSEMLRELSALLAQADEACISKLAGERYQFPELILAALLLLEQEAPTAWYLSAIKKEPLCHQLMIRFMHMSLKDKFEKNALERLFRHIEADWLRKPFAPMALTSQGAEAPFYNFPMSAIAHGRRSVVELLLQMVPEAFGERHLFGFSVLSAALLKDDADILQDLLAGLPREVVNKLATEPVLSPEEAKYRGAGAKALEVNLVALPRFTLGSMPGFNLLALASGSAALRCLSVLLRHDHGRIAVQTCLTHWEEIFAWPDLKPAVREMLEDFMVAHLCRCIPHIGNSAGLAHWMGCVKHLFFDASSIKAMAPAMRLVVEHKRYDLARLLLNSATRAQLVALKREANASDWAGVFPGIDEPMLAVLKTAEARIDADELDAAAHSSGAASSRAPQSLQ